MAQGSQGTASRQRESDMTMASVDTSERFKVSDGGESGRPVRVRKLYITDANKTGDVRASADEPIRVASLLFVENGTRIDIDLDHMADQFPNWFRAAAAFGCLTAAANAATSAKKEDGTRGDLDDMINAAEDRVAQFLEGEWSEGAAGPRVSDFVTAYVESRKVNGIVVPDAAIAALREKLSSKALTPKALLADLTVRREYHALKERRAAERAAKAAEAAQGAGMSSELDDLINA